jgi:hypothetical protein
MLRIDSDMERRTEMAHAPAPLNGLPITQIAVVVKDIRQSLEHYHRTLGWGPWSVYVHKPPRHHDTFLRGKPVEYSMICAETHVGPVDFELIQPLDGPSLYKEFLEKHGEGVQHIACMGTGANYEENIENFKKMGFNLLMGGSIGDNIRYYYLDSDPVLKFTVESGSGHAISIQPDWVYPDPAQEPVAAEARAHIG